MLDLMFITNETSVAKEAEKAGVNRIFVDLEVNGKKERQGHLDTYISDHKIEDVSKIKKALTSSELLVRVNPYYDGTQYEVDECIRQGADIIMLPMFKTRDEVEKFIKCVNGRAKVCLLLETSQALVRVNDIIDVEGIDEIHIGLNDLHLSLNLDFMFELVSEGIVEYLGNVIKNKGIKFGFGGIAKIGEGDVSSELILGEHYRLGSEMVILSRTFRNSNKQGISTKVDIDEEIKKIRNVESNIKNWTNDEFVKNQLLLKKKVRQVAQRKRQ